MQTTAILGEAVGIQWQGVQDRSGTTSPARLTNGLFIGRFKRGRTDRAMLVTNDTIRARLGYDPTNADYIAIQDALDQNVPAVWVQRVGEAA